MNRANHALAIEHSLSMEVLMYSTDGTCTVIGKDVSSYSTSRMDTPLYFDRVPILIVKWLCAEIKFS